MTGRARKGPPPRFTLGQVARALLDADGVMAYAARALGCSPPTVRAYVHHHSALRAVYDRALRRRLESGCWELDSRGAPHMGPRCSLDQVAAALLRAGGRLDEAARALGYHRGTVKNLIARYPAVRAAYDQARRAGIEAGLPGVSRPEDGHIAHVYAPAEVAAALRRAQGNIAAAARALGCADYTISVYARRFPVVAAAFAETRDVAARRWRWAEGVELGDLRAALNVLRYHGRDRGYAPPDRRRSAIEPLALPDDLEELAREAYEELDRLNVGSGGEPGDSHLVHAARGRWTRRLTPTDRAYLLAARAAGCPYGQWLNLRQGGYAAQPRQLDFHAACRQADLAHGPTEIGFGGARGPGKSHAMLAQLALDDCQRQPELRCLLLRKVGKTGRRQFEDLRGRVLRHIPHDYTRSSGTIVFENGSQILLGHFQDESDIDAYLGLEFDVVAVEEATTLTLSKYRAIRSVNRSSKAGWRPRTYTTTNPGGVGHAWYKQIYFKPYLAGTELATRFIPATVDDNVFINAEYRGYLDTLAGWLKRAWRFGDWDLAVGQFFTTFRHDVHVIAPRPIPPNWRVWLAMDYGFTHYNVILLFAQDAADRGTVYVVDEHAEQRWLVPRHAQAVRDMLRRWAIEPRRLETFVAGRDCFAARPSAEGTLADQWSDEGFELEPADDQRLSGAAEVLRRLGDVESAIAPSLYLFNTCARLAECLPALQHDPHRPEDVLKIDVDEDGVGGDDTYDALRYGLMVAAGQANRDASVDDDDDLRRVAFILNNWRG